LRSWKPTLVFFNSGTLLDGLPQLEEIAASGVPYLTLTHLVSTDNWPDDTTAAALVRLFSGARRAGFVSQHNLALFQTQTAAKLTNSHLWRNPYLVSHDRQPTWPEGDTLRLAFPARIHPRTKGHDLLIEVMSQEKWRSRAIQVSIYGRGPWENSLTRLIQQRGLDATVQYRGHSQDIQALWDEHHALLLPSRHEGLPICVVEAMMAARPCIVNPAGGSAELLEDGVTGFISRECSAPALDEALERAWQRRADWQQIGLRAAESVRLTIPADPADVLARELLG
jgi:glycosyltransferase involved in cell wall biosynthesis